jgi:hypothetical protein
MAPNKLCPYCEGEYSKLCGECREVCDPHKQKEFDEERSLRPGLEKCERCDVRPAICG